MPAKTAKQLHSTWAGVVAVELIPHEREVKGSNTDSCKAPLSLQKRILNQVPPEGATLLIFL